MLSNRPSTYNKVTVVGFGDQVLLQLGGRLLRGGDLLQRDKGSEHLLLSQIPRANPPRLQILRSLKFLFLLIVGGRVRWFAIVPIMCVGRSLRDHPAPSSAPAFPIGQATFFQQVAGDRLASLRMLRLLLCFQKDYTPPHLLVLLQFPLHPLQVRRQHRELKKDFVIRSKGKKAIQENIDELEKKFHSIQMLKFGRTVDLELLEQHGNTKQIEELRLKAEKAEHEADEVMKQWKNKLAKVGCISRCVGGFGCSTVFLQVVTTCSRGFCSGGRLPPDYGRMIRSLREDDTLRTAGGHFQKNLLLQMKQVLAEETAINSTLLEQLVDLGYSKVQLDEMLNTRLANVTISDDVNLENKMRDMEGLADLVNRQQAECSALQAEIQLFRRKGGHIYTTVTSSRNQ